MAAEPQLTMALQARGIGMSFGGLRALDKVDIDVAPGEIVGVIGPNGAGKTTLFDCLSGFLPCDGSVWIGGNDVSGLLPHRRAAAGLGRSFQDARLFPTMTVLDAMRVASELHARGGVFAAAFGLPVSRDSERRVTETALDLIATLGLTAYRDKLIRELSTGTRRIVDLGCVLAQRPSVVMLDEPSSGIAQREAEALGALLRRLRDRTGAAMLLIEHDMPLLLGLAERVYALETGNVIAGGPPEEVVHDPEVIRSYLGADAAAINRSGVAGPAAPSPAGAPDKPKSVKRSAAGKKAAATTTGRAGAPARKAPARKTPARKTPARKTPARKTPARKTPARARTPRG